MSMFRIMCIDYGDVRLGIALSDPLQLISRPFSVLVNHDPAMFQQLKEIIQNEKVGKIVLGLPLNLGGEDTPKTLQVRQFAERLRIETALPLEFWDERYSSAEANETLKKMGYNSKQSRALVDKVAASIILQDYLDSRK